MTLTPGSGDGQIRGACPLDCPDTCSWIVTVKNGEPVALRGDPAHPYTRGPLCNKGADYLTYTRSSDRVLYPMRRSAPKGRGEFARISWDEALERIAAGLGDVIAKHRAEAIWPYVGSGNMGLIQGIRGVGRQSAERARPPIPRDCAHALGDGAADTAVWRKMDAQ